MPPQVRAEPPAVLGRRAVVAAARAPTLLDARNRILDATIGLASEGGYDAVQMRAVAGRAHLALSTLYRHCPSKEHLVIMALARELEQLEPTAITGTGVQRLQLLIDRLHEAGLRNPMLTEAFVRASMFADATAAAEVGHVRQLMDGVFAHALSDAAPTRHECQVASVICDVWLSNLQGWVSGRTLAPEVKTRVQRAAAMLVGADGP